MTDLTRISVDDVYSAHPFAREILLRLADAGFDAVLIGGVVRDGLQAQLQRQVDFPPCDVDIATAALPEEIRRLFPDRPILGVGEEFGVLVIVAPDGKRYEVASFRVESEYDGRWPAKVDLVRDLATDVQRRDLTINGLAASAEGEIIDLVGGVQDLVAKRIATIGEPSVRFGEDHLRMMRVVALPAVLAERLTQRQPKPFAVMPSRSGISHRRELATNCYVSLRQAELLRGYSC